MRSFRPTAAALAAGVALLACAASFAAAPDAAALVKEGEGLYRDGAYAEALKRFEGALGAGLETPTLLYQTASCYALASGNKDKEMELKKKAVPLFEKEIASGAANVDSYYYLSAIYINDLKDPVKGTDVARKGVAVLEKPKAAAPASQEALFRAGRLYSFLGKDKEAADYYQKSIAMANAGTAPVDRASLKLALEGLAPYLFKQKDYAGAANAYEGLLKLDPLRDRDRHQWGLALLLAGKPEDANRVWRNGVTDELRTELNYLGGVVTKFVAAGSPASSKLAPKPASLDDGALEQKILQAADALRSIREKEAKVQEAKDEADRKAKEAEAAKPKSDSDLQAAIERLRAKRKAAPPPPPEDPNSEATGAGDPWRALNQMGLHPVTVPPKPPVSPERAAAEKDFFFLMTEYVKRGHLIRNFCFENGLVEMIFR